MSGNLNSGKKAKDDYDDYNAQLPPLRVPVYLKEELEVEADRYGHSLSSYIRWLIDVGRKKLGIVENEKPKKKKGK